MDLCGLRKVVNRELELFDLARACTKIIVHGRYFVYTWTCDRFKVALLCKDGCDFVSVHTNVADINMNFGTLETKYTRPIQLKEAVASVRLWITHMHNHNKNKSTGYCAETAERKSHTHAHAADGSSSDGADVVLEDL